MPARADGEHVAITIVLAVVEFTRFEPRLASAATIKSRADLEERRWLSQPCNFAPITAAEGISSASSSNASNACGAGALSSCNSHNQSTTAPESDLVDASPGA